LVRGSRDLRDITTGTSFYRRVSGVVFVYDVGDRHSFESLQTWFGDAERYATESVDKFLVGNKLDLKRVVSVDEAKVCAVMYLF
jgi:Ras-related protein Rab-1A